MTIKPVLIVQPQRTRSTTPTWEQRQGYRDRDGAIIKEREAAPMTVRELIAFIGPAHVHHPHYDPEAPKRVPAILVEPPNHAGNLPVIQHCDIGILGQIKAIFWWVMR